MTDAATTEPAEITALLAACKTYCDETGKTDSWLARRIMADNDGLARLRDGKDIGVRKLEKVKAALADLIAETQPEKAG